MVDVEFCPFCDSPAHKIISISETLFYCRTCMKFFSLDQFFMKCPKCNHKHITHTDFPMPSGEMVFQCVKCKNMFSAREVLAYNNIKKESL
jgi:ribosomal protein L37AE/L43A